MANILQRIVPDPMVPGASWLYEQVAGRWERKSYLPPLPKAKP
jgi:hypothetical protein